MTKSEKKQFIDLNKTPHNFQSLLFVMPAKKIIMVEDVVQLINVVSLSPAVRKGKGFVVSLEYPWRKAAKHGHNSHFEFAVAIAGTRIDECRALAGAHAIARPQIAVNKRRLGVVAE